jgi:MYXO-CTERM domain-containing protein
LVLLATPNAWAKAKFIIEVTDEPGVGFNDPTPANPVGGNTGKTVGEQRLKVFQTAADAWGQILESAVPIVVDASFAPLECRGGMAVAGQAGPLSIGNLKGMPTTDVYPLALANKILGKDNAPDYPDIQAEFNGAMLDCLGVDWYYGLDGNASADEADLLTTVIHELGHGLGFTNGVKPATGEYSNGGPNVFSRFMLDTSTGKHFPDMTEAERKAALSNVRKLVWDGKRTDAVAARFLAKGSPSLTIAPSPSGFSGVIGEANFGSLLADLSPLTADVAVGNVDASCSTLTGSFSGKAALIFSPNKCASVDVAEQVQKRGGLAMLFAYNQTGSPPPIALEFSQEELDLFTVTIPTLALTQDDANVLKGSAGATATLSADKTMLVGADRTGHALLFASNPAQQGSTGAHWDPLVRPNLIMEPVEAKDPILYLDMERAVLWDIGWTSTCGNGTIDGDEACDDGAANSNYFPDACRLDCTKAKCGDGIVDSGEQCDPGDIGKLGNPDCASSCAWKSGGTGGSGGGSGSGSGGNTGTGGASASSASGESSTSSSGGSTSSGGDSSSGGSIHTSISSSAGKGKSSGCSCRTGRADDPGASLMVIGLALALSFVVRRVRSTKDET